MDTRSEAELHALRATADGFALVGRVRSEARPDGTGWDAFAASIATDGTTSSYRVLDFDRGDVLFDIAQLPGGRFLALGMTGYVQNPNGASVSEDAQPLLAYLDVDGSPIQRIRVTDGPRQDQVRTITSLNGRWLVGGMQNGPGNALRRYAARVDRRRWLSCRDAGFAHAVSPTKVRPRESSRSGRRRRVGLKGEPSWTGEGSRVLLCTKAITSITLSTARLISTE